MRAIKVYLKNRSYQILIGNNILRVLGKYLKKLSLGDTAYLITNSRVRRHYGKLVAKSLNQSGFRVRFKLIPDSEESKSLNVASGVIRDITRYAKNKKLFIIALGGGVVGDLAGFVASIYRRGIDYVQVPTTLLAQADSSIGGKTALDLEEGKNLVGTFHQPRLVFCDVKTLKTLTPRQIRSGLAEIIKCAIIRDKKLFIYLESRCRDILALKPQALEHALLSAIKVKAAIVGADEREEKGRRTVLNFGHTIGHAIEAAALYRTYNHGEAIALGMIVALDISRELGLTNSQTQKRIENIIRAAGLPTRIKKIKPGKIIARHYQDKKFTGSKNRLVLIGGIAKAKVVQNIPLALIKKSLQKTIYS